MRKILYILSLLLLVILPYKVYSQTPPPMWQYFCIGDACVLTFSTQFIYSFNITSDFTSTNVQFITFTVPEQILQQQLYYCKTFDPYVTNNISVSQCEFAWPAVVAIADSNGTVINYWTEYQLIALYYDNVTGLPQTLEFPINLQDQEINGITLSPGTYYLYVYYPSPYLFAGNSIQGQTIPSCEIGYNGGWCANVPFYRTLSMYEASTYSTVRSIWAGNGMAPYGLITRPLNVYYDPSYPVIVGDDPNLVIGNEYGAPVCYYGLVMYSVTNPSNGSTVNICITVPGCGLAPTPPNYYSSCNVAYGPGFYDLRQLLVNLGYNPSQYNKISSVSVYVNGYTVLPGGYVLGGYVQAFYLSYIPKNTS